MLFIQVFLMDKIKFRKNRPYQANYYKGKTERWPMGIEVASCNLLLIGRIIYWRCSIVAFFS